MGGRSATVDELLAEGTRVYVLARSVRVLHQEGGRYSLVARVDNPAENGFHQICVPIERVFLTTIAQPPLPPEPPSLDRLTDRLLGP